jgi:predicted permease
MAVARFDSLHQDARSAWRSLRHRPIATAAAVGILALAIGITAAMFTIVDALILRPLPFADPQQLAVLRMTGKNGGRSATRPSVIAAWRSTHAFASVEAARSREAIITTGSGEVIRRVADVTPGIFNMLGGVRPVRGRLFDDNDARPGTDIRVLISEDLWRAHYRSDPALIGRPIVIDNQPVTVVGILPADFRFPDWNTEVWRAGNFDDPRSASNLWPLVYVRFASNVPRADALGVATNAASQAEGATPGMWATSDPLDAGGPDEYYASAIPLLSGGVALLFIVLCANVGSLLLAGLTARRREVATRLALGAPRWRLARQAFVESTIIGAGGLAAGVALGWTLVSLARAALPALHSLNTLNLDLRALIVTATAGLIATLASGLLPAVIGTRVDVGRSLNLGRAGAETPRARMTTRILLTSQIALSCVLLIGATVLVRSFINLVNADRGIATSNVLVAWVVLTDPSLRTPEVRDTAARAIEEQARTLPGVTHAAWSYGTPPRGAIGLGSDWTPDGGVRVSLSAIQSIVGAEFFDLYGIPIVRGRSFAPSDPPDAILVSERLARTLWPDVDAVGRSVGLDNEEMSPRKYQTFTVIGVVKDTHFPSLNRERDLPQIYTQYRSAIFTPMLSLRCSGPCPDSGAIRRRLAAAAPGARVQSTDLLEDVYATQFARPRATAALAFAFAITALVAAASGLFSLLSYSVTRRRREFGIRSALGASPADVRRLVWRDGMTVTMTGIGAGIVLGISLARILTALLYDVTMVDPVSWGVVAGVLALTIAAASWSPARAAARATPVALLRED